MKSKALLFTALFFISIISCRKDEEFVNAGTVTYPVTKSPGYSAHDLLSSSLCNSMRVEIQYMKGFQPDAASIDNLTQFLKARLNKPNGIVMEMKEIPASGQGSYTAESIRNIERLHRSGLPNYNEMNIYVLFVDGQYSDPNVLGLAYYNTSICIMGKTIQDNSGGITQVNRTTLTSVVLEHEFGHLMGLVDIGSNMVTAHSDPNDRAHCNNKNCLMYRSVETTDLLGFLLTGNVPELDANCLADLKANGGK
jgi:predicted Zn-dependent protease